ncbi:T9SS type A sorting domain-containing protein [Bernardetia sp.]|uniref:T9SS type A sorting domain-containing protein n=1 Tax=Bernardetia sp. TaxID=1937974 RepID=UPI0025C1ABE4|nr:T9SS type A sorting domain-containing protein [Bernardetia sp.]
MNKKYLLVGATALGLSAGIFGYSQLENDNLAKLSKNQQEISGEEQSQTSAEKKAAKHNKKGYFKTAEASGYFKYMDAVRTKDGDKYPSYKTGYTQIALEKAQENMAVSRTETFTFDARGPGNVAGRTRSVLVDVRDSSNNTWFIGTAGGGIWKTSDGGATWEDKSGNMSHLGISSLAQCESSPNVMYATTGETPFRGNGINGGGVFKSTDGGETWNRLDSTIPRTTDFLNATRVIVSPSDPNLVLVTSAHNPFTSAGTDPDDRRTSYILRSTDGGNNWTITYSDPVLLQQIVAEPGNFNNMYATGAVFGNPKMVRSIDAGLTWIETNMTSIVGVEDTEGVGIGRSELAISPTNPSIIYSSIEINGTSSRLLVSDDRGVSWKIVEEDGKQKNEDYLGGQGGYDNAITVDPTNPNKVYWGGVDLWSAEIKPNDTRTGERQFISADFEEVDFLSLVNVTGFNSLGGALDIQNPNLGVSVEIRFGAGKSQKAHRFLAGGGNVGASIPATDYVYQDYVDVPFEVWDIENNQQLMVSFRDQRADGEFTLTEQDRVGDPDLLDTREYLFIHAIPYNATVPSSSLTVNGGHEVQQIYFIWPYLTEGESFSPSANAILRFNYGSPVYVNSTITRISDGYNADNNTGNNTDELHVDHHMLKFAGTSRLISVNDGGLAYSDNAGRSWTEVDNLRTNNIVTSQYYKVDRHPTENRYVGGMQDNGSWISSNNPTPSTDYTFATDGDGMEAVWHATDPNLILTSSQHNNVRRSTDGGASFFRSTTGLSETGDNGSAPFVTRLGYSPLSPDVVFAVGASGIYKSTNFGNSWTQKRIENELWNFSVSTTNVFPSLASPNVVWAGSGMSEERTMFLSTNGGETFNPLPNTIDIGAISGFTTDPEDTRTAYMLFGQGQVGKIWRTTDLGQTWEEISGFGQGTASSTGFPDVVPFSMTVWGDTLLVGTEIGLVASYNNAASWELVPEFPPVAIFSLTVKREDGQLVIGTHGRGVWSSDLGITYTPITGLLEPTDAISLKVFPNPTQNWIRFELPKITDSYDIRIYTITGQEVMASSSRGGGNVELNIEKFVGGTYILKATNGNKVYVQKVVLQK